MTELDKGLVQGSGNGADTGLHEVRRGSQGDDVAGLNRNFGLTETLGVTAMDEREGQDSGGAKEKQRWRQWGAGPQQELKGVMVRRGG